MNRYAALACVTFTAVLTACSSNPARKPFTVGCKNFTEQFILGEIVAQQLEKRLGERVDRRFPIGGTLVAHQAELTGEIDIYPEYTGVAYHTILRLASTTEADIIRERVKDEYAKQFQLAWIPLGFGNSTAVVVRDEDARTSQLKSVTDAAGGRQQWKIGATTEFLERPDGFPNLMAAYHLRLANAPRTMDYNLLYKALAEKQVDMIAGHNTDGMLSSAAVRELADDKRAFPPNEAGMVVREAAIQFRPHIRAALQDLTGKITIETMRKLNYEVDGQHRKPADVAAGFLRQAGL